MRRLIFALLLFASPVAAQTITPPPPPDLSGYALTSTVPTPGVSAPPAETIGGAAGSTASQFAMANHTHPRISRSTTVTTDASGNFAVSWQTALAQVPTVDLTWVNTGTQPITCELTADPTTTAVQGRCRQAQTTTLNLSIVTAGLTLAPFTAAPTGVKVHVIAFPPTQ